MVKNHNIFEEVDHSYQRSPQTGGGLIDDKNNQWRIAVLRWMLFLFILVVFMIFIGGLTRLTDSGLSITQWNVIKGIVPPMSELAWLVEFDKYKAIPEYQLQNYGMSLDEFKIIYWWEWGHRQLGRCVGLTWVIGFTYFIIRYQIPKQWLYRMLILGLLGGLQGFVGWWMVSSGLTGKMLDVASYRLAIHLGLAFIILSLLFWYILELRARSADLLIARRFRDGHALRMAQVLFVLAFIQILLGALVAGIDAGRGYIDWPMMNGEFLPSESFDYAPMWINFFENSALVQFNHRMMGYMIILFAGYLLFKYRFSGNLMLRRMVIIINVSLWMQAGLGIMTILYAAPWQLAILHQLGAIICVCLILRYCFMALYSTETVLR